MFSAAPRQGTWHRIRHPRPPFENDDSSALFRAVVYHRATRTEWEVELPSQGVVSGHHCVPRTRMENRTGAVVVGLQSALALTPSLAALLVILAGVCFVFGGRRAGRRLLLVAIAVIALPTVLATLGLPAADWRNWLPSYVDERVVIYALYIVGFLVAMNLLRHLLAFFVGYGAADSAVGNLLASATASVFAILKWPFRAMRRLARGSRSWGEDP